MCGNSFGLQPKRTKKFLNQELEDWGNTWSRRSFS